MSIKMDFQAQVRETADRHAMFAAEQTVVVGVSGGPDSVALLHSLHVLRNVWQIALVAAHFDHGFRGAESAADADYVRGLCDQLGIPCYATHEDIPGQAKRLHLSALEAARRARHRFFRAVAGEVGAQKIALGHTRDDRVETILLNVFRGTGPDGLAGFLPDSSPLVRPLYDIGRANTVEYCRLQALQPRIDPSNRNLKYRRNRIRHEVLPYLAEHFNPRISDALIRMSELIAAENEELDRRAISALRSMTIEHEAYSIAFSASDFNVYSVVMRRRILRNGIFWVRESLYGIENDIIDAALAAAELGRHYVVHLPRDNSMPCNLEVDADTLRIYHRPEASKVIPWHVTLPEDGRHVTPVGDILVRTFASPEEARAWFQTQSVIAGDQVHVQNALILPLAGLRLPLAARSWQPGDRMRPRGMTGSKKLQDIFIDRKIPRDRRRLVPVIVEADNGTHYGEDSPALEEPITGRVLGLLGVQSSDIGIPVADVGREAEYIGACMLIVALTDSPVT